MAAAISPNTGRAYGVARVCDGFGVARSSFYAWRRQQEFHCPAADTITPRCQTGDRGRRGAERHPRRSRPLALDW